MKRFTLSLVIVSLCLPNVVSADPVVDIRIKLHRSRSPFHQVVALAYSPSGTRLLVRYHVSNGDVIKVIDRRSGDELESIDCSEETGKANQFSSAQFLGDDRIIFVHSGEIFLRSLMLNKAVINLSRERKIFASEVGVIRDSLWTRTASKSEVTFVRYTEKFTEQTQLKITKLSGYQQSLILSKDRVVISDASEESSFCIHDFMPILLARSTKAHEGSIDHFCYSDQLNLLFSSGDDGRVFSWALGDNLQRSLKMSKLIHQSSYCVNSMSLSSDGRSLLILTDDKPTEQSNILFCSLPEGKILPIRAECRAVSFGQFHPKNPKEFAIIENSEIVIYRFKD